MTHFILWQGISHEERELSMHWATIHESLDHARAAIDMPDALIMESETPPDLITEITFPLRLYEDGELKLTIWNDADFLEYKQPWRQWWRRG
jgi:hypothetical protein